MCDKVCYPSKIDVQIKFNQMRSGRRHSGRKLKIKKRPQRYYFCHDCEAWHITSRKTFD
jgi:hypothetical protein